MTASSSAREPAMVDVARLAGVSHQTVSRVLNNHPNVRDETARRVRAAIAELGYRPNRAARALVTGRTQQIGVVALYSTLFGPGVAARRVRAGRGGRRLRGERRQREQRWTGRRSARSVERHLDQRVAGHRRHRPGRIGRRGARPDCRLDVPAGHHRRRPAAARRARHRRPAGRRCAWPPATCSTPGTGPCGTSPGRRTGSTAPVGSAAGSGRCVEAGAEVPPVLPADWSAGVGLPGRAHAGPDPRGHRGVRGQRPPRAGPAARAARARPPGAARRQRGRVRRRARGRLLHPAADHRHARTSTPSAGAPCACCWTRSSPASTPSARQPDAHAGAAQQRRSAAGLSSRSSAPNGGAPERLNTAAGRRRRRSVDGLMGPFTFAFSGASSRCTGCTARTFRHHGVVGRPVNPCLDAATCYR